MCQRKIGARFVPNVPYAQKLFWMYPMVLLADMVQVEARFRPFGYSANLDARWYTVCAECTIGLEIILEAPNGTPR